jgi:hypothetical protein
MSASARVLTLLVALGAGSCGALPSLGEPTAIVRSKCGACHMPPAPGGPWTEVEAWHADKLHLTSQQTDEIRRALGMTPPL